MRAKLLIAAAAGLVLLAQAQAQAPPGGPPPSPTADDDDGDHDGDHDGMGRRPHMGTRPGPWNLHPGPPLRAGAEQPRLAPAIHLRHGDLVLVLDCSIRDTAEDCAEAAVRLIERFENSPPRP